jgi:hypothetical protein
VSRREDLTAWFTDFGRVALRAKDFAIDDRFATFLDGLGKDAISIAKSVGRNEQIHMPDVEEDYITMRDT